MAQPDDDLLPFDSPEYAERLLSATVRRFVATDRLDLALPLLDAEVVEIRESSGGHWRIDLVVSAETYDAFEKAARGHYVEYETGTEYSQAWGELRDTMEALIPPGKTLDSATARVRLDPVEPGWREAAYANLQGGNPNQGNLVSKGNLT